MLAKDSSFVMSLFQALAPLIVWAELGVGRGGEQRGKVPPRGVTLDRARELQRDRGSLWPRNLGPANPARNLGPNPHPRDLGSSPARNLGSSSPRESGSGGQATRESEAYPRRNTSTPFIRQSLPPGEQSAGQMLINQDLFDNNCFRKSGPKGSQP